ncbi:hypothetical protein ACLBWH_09545 [Sphingomonas sp. M6A6_1c]
MDFYRLSCSIRFIVSIGDGAVLIVALLSLMGLANQMPNKERREAMFDDIWSKAIPRFEHREIARGIRRPIISELHHAVGSRPKVKSDLADEAKISATFGRNGVGPDKYNYHRFTCRRGLCEIVIITSRVLPDNRAGRIFEGINRSSGYLCPKSRCVAVAIMAAGKWKVDGTSLLIYFVPRG